MSKVMKTVLAAGLSAIMALGALPVQAMPLVKAPAVSNVELAQWGPPGRHDGRRPGYHRPPPRGEGWHNGYRGYRDRRPGYRYHNGFWFPLGAFAAGAIIGGAMSQPTVPARPPVGAGSINPKHYDWCVARYRSYRMSDNTFQPNRGPRQQCYSPYY